MLVSEETHLDSKVFTTLLSEYTRKVLAGGYQEALNLLCELEPP